MRVARHGDLAARGKAQAQRIEFGDQRVMRRDDARLFRRRQRVGIGLQRRQAPDGLLRRRRRGAGDIGRRARGPVERAQRPLGRLHEMRRDLVVLHLDPDRVVLVRRAHLDDVAAHAELAALQLDVVARVLDRHQLVEQVAPAQRYVA